MAEQSHPLSFSRPKSSFCGKKLERQLHSFSTSVFVYSAPNATQISLVQAILQVLLCTWLQLCASFPADAHKLQPGLQYWAQLSETQGTAHSTRKEGEGVVMGPGDQRYQTLALTSMWSPSAHAEQALVLCSKRAKVGMFTLFNLRYTDQLQLPLSAGEGLNPGPALPA